MRILLAAPHPDVHGPVFQIASLLVEVWRGLGCEVTVVPWGRHKEQESLADKVLGRFGDILRLKRTLFTGNFDLFLIKTAHDWPALSRDIPLLLATRGRRPVTVVHFHGSQPEKLIGPGNRLFKMLSRWLVRNCDATLLLSTEECRLWEKFYPRGRFHAVSNPYVPNSTSAVGAVRSTTVREGPPALLFVGRLMVDKGIFDLLRAAALIKDRVPFRLMVAGDGPAAQEFRTLTETLGLSDRVVLTGYLRGDDLAAAYRAADVLVLPSYREGLPMVVLEAMDAGLAVVSTRIRGTADHLLDGEHVLFVPPRDPPALAAALERILTDEPLRSRMGQANRERVKKFLPLTVGQEYLQVLKEVVGAAARSRPRRTIAGAGDTRIGQS